MNWMSPYSEEDWNRFVTKSFFDKRELSQSLTKLLSVNCTINWTANSISTAIGHFKSPLYAFISKFFRYAWFSLSHLSRSELFCCFSKRLGRLKLCISHIFVLALPRDCLINFFAKHLEMAAAVYQRQRLVICFLKLFCGIKRSLAFLNGRFGRPHRAKFYPSDPGRFSRASHLRSSQSPLKCRSGRR